MLNGEPYISQASVSDALDTLIYPSKSAEPNPLERLLLVDLFIADPNLPKGEHLREFALQQILLDLIVKELTAKRAMLGLPPPVDNEPLSEAERVIEAAGRTRNAEFLLWTLLYYRYVRADLSIEPERMSRLISVNVRSLRRYFHYALRLLTRRLLHEEWAARIAHHRQRLFALLPCGVPLKLIGRDAQLEQAWDALMRRPPCRIYITGTTGIGKTSFSEALLQRLINADAVDHLIWLNSPPSCEYVRRYLAEALLIPHHHLSLRDYLSRYPTALVIDNADDLLKQPEQVIEMLRELSTVVVVLTSSVYTPLLEVDLHIPLSELDEVSVYELVRQSPYLGDLLVEDVAPWIWTQIGGNPLAVKIAMSLMSFEEMDVIRAHAAEETIGKAFECMTEAGQLYCCALSLLPSATIQELQSLWHGAHLHEALSELTRFFFVEQSNGNYRLTTGAATYIREQYAIDPRIQR
ncbi:MAG TPA: ATP-binding protein, partial [Oceanobacillus sp.]|nr:ATP-binding protein [Oceanobacillus sp.]